MYTVLIGLFLPLVIFIVYFIIAKIFRRDLEDYFHSDSFETLGFLTFFSVVCAIVIGFIIPYDYTEKVSSYNLESLEDGNSQVGSFFLGCGLVNDEITYSFYYEKKGYYHLQQLEPYNVSIKYSNGKPKFIIYKQCASDNLGNDFVLGFGTDGRERYVLSVPKGTIKNNYYLDTK